ncbi:DUF4221 domain-containing protein [Echinicola soli]|uniref:DUF4221 domain-containing protein n=1 Tax=Echinicola soli TaxID=2591634 RepID=A0A514CGT9_9BACT|nr:DUF4221 family protein [Echinicola soli]QDH79023.1 DUF4221 domain-containing protein [Echinicola soli]
MIYIFMRNSFFLVLLFLTISCKRKTQEGFGGIDIEGDDVLNKTGSFSLHLDEFASYEIFSHQVVPERKKEKLYVLNKQNRSLDIYDLELGQLEKRIEIPSEGPGGITNPYGFFVHNRDSIFVFVQGTFKNTQLLNAQGELTRTFTPENIGDFRFGLINHASVPSTPSYYMAGKIYFGEYGLYSSNDPENFNRSVKMAGEYDLLSGKVEMYRGFGFPASYLGRAWNEYHSVYSRVLNKDREWAVSWSGLDSILVYDSDYRLVESRVAKSNYLSSFSPPKKGETLRIAIEEGGYIRLLYSPYLNCYYRIVRHGREFDAKYDRDVNAFDRSDFSIIKLDSSLNVISETKFHGGVYNLFCVFVSNRGLCLPRNSYWNPDLKEELLKIDVFH